jgi:Rha family phage regulatory protein
MVDLVKDLVEKKGKPMISSLTVAKRFGKEHRNVLRNIRELDNGDEFSLLNFEQSDFKNSRGKNIEQYLMSRDGFSLLVMGFTGEQAIKWKKSYILAFNRMEEYIQKNIKGEVWKQARIQGKNARLGLTDVIKEFAEYAKSQGSQHADRYFGSITTMEYKALALLDQFKENKHEPDGFRNTLDHMQLSSLCMAENLAKHWILTGMKDELHYKEIFQLAKRKVQEYADIACVTYLSGIED